MMRDLNLWYSGDPEVGWYLDVPFALPRSALQRAVEYVLPKQIDRWRSLPHGDMRDDLAKGIRALQAGKIEQRVVGARGDGSGDIVAFEAKQGRQRLYSFPGLVGPGGERING